MRWTGRQKGTAAGVAGVLAVGGVTAAIASPGGGEGRGGEGAGAATMAVAPPGGHPGVLAGPGARRHRDELAQALADKLGVDEARVRRALDEIAKERREAGLAALAKGLAERLDVSTEDAERAIRAGHRAVRSQRVPDPREAQQAFVREVADELGKSPDEVRRALQGFHRSKMEARLDEAVKSGRLTEEQAERLREWRRDGPGPGPGGPRHGPGGPPMFFGPPPGGGR